MSHLSTATPLPVYPRLRPGLEVLVRRDGEIQIGLDPRHAVVVGGVPVELVRTLRRLDGRQSSRELLARAGTEHVERLRGLLTELAGHGLLEDTDQAVTPEPELSSLRAGAQAIRGRSGSAVAVHGDGRLAVAVAVLLATAGIGRIDPRASGTVTISDLGSGYTDADVGSRRRAATAAAIGRANPRTVTSRLIGAHRPDIAVLADSVVPAPDLVRELVTDGVPHLLVRVRDGIGIVGPLVLPWRTSCLRCADLHRAALDSCWPTVAGQLAGRTQRAELGSVHATAALTAGQVLRALNPADGAPRVWNATLELDPYAGSLRRRLWPPHPDCPCGVAAPP